MSIEAISIQMLIQGRELSLQQRGDAQKELNKLVETIQSQAKEIEELKKDKLFYSKQWEKQSKQNTQLKQKLKESEDRNKKVEKINNKYGLFFDKVISDGMSGESAAKDLDLL